MRLLKIWNEKNFGQVLSLVRTPARNEVKVILVLILFFLTLSACTLMSGINSPMYLFQNDECTYPCWNGIKLKETGFQDVKSIIDKKNLEYVKEGGYFAELVDSSYNYLDYRAKGATILFFLDNDQKVGDIEFSINDNLLYKITIDDFIAYFGKPQKLGICVDRRGRISVNYSYPDINVVLSNLYKSRWTLEGSYELDNMLFRHIQFVRIGQGSWSLNKYDFEIPWEEADKPIILDLSKRLPDSQCENLMGK